MNKLLRALIAGWGAKKLGGGCLSTILVFIVIYWALGTCNGKTNRNPVPSGQTTSTKSALKNPVVAGLSHFKVRQNFSC